MSTFSPSTPPTAPAPPQHGSPWSETQLMPLYRDSGKTVTNKNHNIIIIIITSYIRLPRLSSLIFSQLVKKKVSYVENITKEEWRRKDLSTCILTKDPECSLNPGETKDLAIPYFCGQDTRCQVLGNTWAVERAMENVRKLYSVVGVIEDFDKTLTVLEERFPDFFGGVIDLYFNILHGKNKETTVGLSSIIYF
jgi:hypothetical protein